MALPASNSDLYLHVRVVISIIVSLCITTLLSGLAQFVQHPRRERVSILNLGWAASLLLWIIHFWWWEFRLSMVENWTFVSYFFVITYAILFYFLCTLLFPSDLRDYAGYEDYFLSRRIWFFGFLAATFLADVVDTKLKGDCDDHPESTHSAHAAGHLSPPQRFIRPATLPPLVALFNADQLKTGDNRVSVSPQSEEGSLLRNRNQMYPDRDEHLRSQKARNK